MEPSRLPTHRLLPSGRAGGESRTHNRRFTKPVLCRLSYASEHEAVKFPNIPSDACDARAFSSRRPKFRPERYNNCERLASKKRAADGLPVVRSVSERDRVRWAAAVSRRGDAVGWGRHLGPAQQIESYRPAPAFGKGLPAAITGFSPVFSARSSDLRIDVGSETWGVGRRPRRRGFAARRRGRSPNVLWSWTWRPP